MSGIGEDLADRAAGAGRDPEVPDSSTNFFHMSVFIVAVTLEVDPGGLEFSAIAIQRFVGASVEPPADDARAGTAVADDAGRSDGGDDVGRTADHACRRPGSARCARPLSTPFCSVMTRVFGPIIGRVCLAAASVSQSLTAKRTTSTGPTACGSSVTLTSLQMQVAERAFDDKTIGANDVAMRAARDEGHVMAGRGHRAPKYPPTAPAAASLLMRMKKIRPVVDRTDHSVDGEKVQ